MRLPHRSLSLALFGGLMLTLCTSSTAQETDRPKIGLALAGGGAKGAAHIGVLKVLEEMQIPVDYIAGTSMGAVIGGLYASGMSADELEAIMLATDWARVMEDKPPRRELSFRRKEDNARYLLDLEAGFKNKRLVWPRGLKTGQNLFFMLQSYTLPVAGVSDFDQLPIPFKAVATDVERGRMVVLDSGHLATAIRASMAIPGVFSPVVVDGVTMVDGGIVNNVPVDVVRAMGADIVIAVDLGASLDTRRVESFVQIYRQTMRMLTRPNMEPQLAAADLVIVPGTSIYGTLEFDATAAIVELGLNAAQERAPDLEPLSVSIEEYKRRMSRHKVPEHPVPVVDYVRVEGNKRVDTRIIENLLRLEIGAPLDLEELDEDIRRVYGLGDFETIDFAIEHTEEGLGVVVSIKEKPWGPNYVRLGLSIATDIDGTSGLGLLFNLTNTRLNKLGAELRNDLQVGNDRFVSSEFYQPLDFTGHWFVAPRVEYRNQRIAYFSEGSEVAQLEVSQVGGSFDLGYQFSRFAELRLGLLRSNGSASVKTGTVPEEDLEGVDLDNIDRGGYRFLARLDRLDNARIPRDGGLWIIDAYVSNETLGADDRYNKVQITGSQFFQKKQHTFFGSMSYGFSPNSVLPVYDDFTLGGFPDFPGYKENELRGQYLGKIRAGYYYYLFESFYVGGWITGANVFELREQVRFDSLLLGATLVVMKDTFLGPLYLGYGVAEDGGTGNFWLAIGRTL